MGSMIRIEAVCFHSFRFGVVRSYTGLLCILPTPARSTVHRSYPTQAWGVTL